MSSLMIIIPKKGKENVVLQLVEFFSCLWPLALYNVRLLFTRNINALGHC